MVEKGKVDITRIFIFGLALAIVISSFYLIVDKYFERADILHKDGIVEIKRFGKKEWIVLTDDIRIGNGDVIKTGNSATVELELPGEAFIKVGENSLVKINEIGMVEITKRADNKIELLYGKVRAVVAPFVNNRSKFLIRDDEIFIGVRGTDFGVIRNIDEEWTQVLSLDGEISVGSMAKEVVVKADEKMSVTKDGKNFGTPTKLDKDFKKDFLIEMDFESLKVRDLIRDDLKDFETNSEPEKEIVEVEPIMPEGGKSYTVKPGDNLWKIAEELYGEGVKYPIAYDANREKIKDPNLIYPNQVIIIPPLRKE